MTVTTDGKPTTVPVTITVYDVRLPAPAAVDGNLLTAFHVVPESYVNKVDKLYHLGSNTVRAGRERELFSFLAAHRISPAGWGFGEPRTAAGYTSSRKWWLDAATNMVRQRPGGVLPLRIPISNQRASVGNRIAKISPFAPDTWCGYLGRVRSLLGRPRLARRAPRLPVHARRARAGGDEDRRQAGRGGHTCWAGSKMLVTGNPSVANSFLWDGKDGDDVDIWAVLSRRYYGQYGKPTEKLAVIDAPGAPAR